MARLTYFFTTAAEADAFRLGVQHATRPCSVNPASEDPDHPDRVFFEDDLADRPHGMYYRAPDPGRARLELAGGEPRLTVGLAELHAIVRIHGDEYADLVCGLVDRAAGNEA